MGRYTPLNLEQSVARYLSEKFIEEDYGIYWYDTKQTVVGSGTQVSILRKFPPKSNSFARQDSTISSPGLIKVPAFTIFVNGVKTDEGQRLGIGETVFTWTASARIDGFADNELEWYKIRGWFSDWFGNPDSRTTVYDYQADINSDAPDALGYQIQYRNTDVLGDELDETPAVRYYINCSATLEFVE